jgi:predicted metalloendopeptidase
VDPSHWDLISQLPIFPQTVTAFNAESPNIMFLPAGITQWPLFHTQFPPAMMYGGFAMIAGHELTHGFDEYGREFDAFGKLYDWWTPYTAEQFNNLSSCMVNQYNQYEVQPGLFIDGLMTVNENIADNGGLRESWTAYRTIIGGPSGGVKASIVPGFTNDQLFFLQFGQMWCFKMTPEYEQQWVKTNVHATPKFRVQGVLSNMQEFADAFRCQINSTYNPSTKCQVW